MNSTRPTDFITPKTPVSKTFRNAVLALAQHYALARALKALADHRVPVEAIVVAARGQAAEAVRTVIDKAGRIRERYDMQAGSTYLAVRISM